MKEAIDKNQKILVYGTGKNAEKIINYLKGFLIVGIIDRIKFCGEFKGIPILSWDDIEEGMADVIIIAASQRNYKEIYGRIIDKCVGCYIKILDMEGKELITEFGLPYVDRETAQYYKRNEEELKALIDQYEAISFDLFDTLVMRKLLEPTDLFDKLEDVIAKQGIFIKEFKKVRREAELCSNGGNIYQIYKVLKEKAKISEEESKQILEEEIRLEKKYLIKREKMVHIMKYAIKQGKMVYIISDMYLPSEVLIEILNSLGIKEYIRLYVSCEYGVSKGNGLYEIYKKEIGNRRGLHIGDSEYADVFSAKKAGLGAYGIKSALEIMKLSSLRKALLYANNYNEKALVGVLISKLFQDPFVLYGTSGVVKITSIERIGQLFVAPLVILYMITLFRKIEKERKYSGVLFPTRDGYLFKKLYDKWYEKHRLGKEGVPSYYFAASRKICLRVIADSQISLVTEYSNGNCQEVLQKILGIQDAKEYRTEIYHTEEEYYGCYLGQIKQKSQEIKENYKKYIEQCGIALDKNYLFCELTSQGTVQYALNSIFKIPLEGLYLCRNVTKLNRNLIIEAIYQRYLDQRSMITENNNFLEVILTSKEASVCDIEKKGEIVLAEEVRVQEELIQLDMIQNGIETFFFEFMEEICIEEKNINKRLPEILLELSNNVEYEGECCLFIQKKLYEDLFGRYLDIFSN